MSDRPEYLTVRSLEPDDAGAVSAFLQGQPPEYLRFFYAFGSDEAEFRRLLEGRTRDLYAGVFWDGRLAALYFLRGWDAGYEVPAFGVLVGVEHRGGRFLQLTMDVAKLTCRQLGVPRYMCKIHPDNVSPRGAGRLGLVQTGVEEGTGNVVYHMET
jgi:hypothetical protein